VFLRGENLENGEILEKSLAFTEEYGEAWRFVEKHGESGDSCKKR
jgi:hypothetical protein